MNKIKIFISLFASLLVFHSSSHCQAVFDSAVSTYLNGNDQKSIEMFTLLINNKELLMKSNKQLAACHMYRGAAKAFLGKLDESLKDLDSAKAIDSTVMRLHFYYSKTYLFKQEGGKALHFANLAIAEMPEYADAFDQRAVAKFMLNDIKGTIEDEDTAIKFDSTDYNFYVTRGWAKSTLKQYNEAISDYDKALKLQPDVKAFANRGVAYSKLNEHAKAIEDYSMAIAMNEELGDVYYFRGLSYKALGKKIQACLDFSKSAELGYKEAAAELSLNGCR
ncbi:MAG: hypothetical protein ABI402_06145 [Ferruginibacter sp.]